MLIISMIYAHLQRIIYVAHKLLYWMSEISRGMIAMKRALVYIVSVAFLLSALAFAADKPATDATKVDSAKTNVVKSAKMNATGKVIEISDSSIKIERTVKGNAETMEFVLEKPAENIAVNDSVKIAYIEQDGQLLVSRVVKATPKKMEKKK
jgi:hypothetical protein